MRLLILPILIVVGLLVATACVMGSLPVVERWLQRRAQVKRERLAFERCESLVALITIDPVLAERVYQELGEWRKDGK